MEIPYQSLKREILLEMLKEIVTRDGTDYGHDEKSVEAKVSSALVSLEQGKALLYWSEETETASLHSPENKPPGL